MGFFDFLKSKVQITHRVQDRHEPQQAKPIQEVEVSPQDENKNRLTSQFRLWLDSFDQVLESASVSVQELETQIDLYSLFSEFIALKNEVQRQSRQYKSSMEQLSDVVRLLQSSSEALKAEQTARKEDNRQMALRIIIMEILDIRDRIEEGLRILKKRKPSFWKRLFRIKESLLGSIIEGQEMILGRIDRMLLSYEVTPIGTEEAFFDPHCMRAVEIDDIPDKSDGLVLEEIRKGFMINNEIVRVAEVKVNRIRTMESCKGADL